MPAKSQQQLKFIYALRNKYKTKKKAPKKFKWVFDKEWTEGVKMKKLPEVVDKKESFILTFEKFNMINEAVIEPNDFKEELEKVLLSNDIKSLDDINDKLKHLGVKFSSRQEWVDSLEDQDEKENVPQLRPTPFGFSYAGYNYYNDTIYIIGDVDTMFNTIRMFKSRGNINQYIDTLNDIIRHEQIHKEQNKRRNGIKPSNLKNNPESKRKDYLSDKDEIMAHARTLVDILSKMLSKDDIIRGLRHGNLRHPMFSEYKRIGGDVFKRFIKYIYMYLTPEND